MKKVLLTIIYIYTAVLCCYGQGKQQRVSGHVRIATGIDKGSGSMEPLPYANVTVLSLPDSVIKAGAATDAQGNFSLTFTRKPKTKYVIKVTYMGYRTAHYQIKSDKSVIQADTLTLLSGSFRMRGIMVKEYVQAVEQRGDTAIYNAEAFRLPQGAYLEALVRRIPGLIYDSKSQSITYNGYTITEITVNGTEFFKGNSQIALENLPASMISQLKVYDKETEEEKATGIKSGQKNYVLDLRTKKRLNGSLLASVEAGYGTHDKRDINGQLFRFNDKGDNFSALGSSTNRYSTSSYDGNLTNSLGINFSKRFKNRLKVAFNANYTDDKNGQASSSNQEQYLNYASQFNSSESFSLTRSKTFRSNTDIKWEIDSVTVLNVTGYFNFDHVNTESDNRTASFSMNPENNVKDPFALFDFIDNDIRINDNQQYYQSKSNRADYNVRASLTRKTDKKGSNVSIAVQMSGNVDNGKSYTNSSTTYFRLKNILGLDSVYQRTQYQNTPSDVRNYRLNISYTHAFTKRSRLQVMYGLEMKDEDSRTDTYDLTASQFTDSYRIGLLPADYKDTFSDSLSNRNEGHTTGHRITLRYNYSGRRLNISASMSVQPQNRSIENNKGKHYVDTTLYSTELRPQLNINYRSDRLIFNIGYSGATKQPSLSSLVAPTDYSSPLNIVRSNPDLKPSYTQQIQTVLTSIKTGLTATLNWQHELHTITRYTIYHSETGGIETIPMNVDGNWGMQANISYDKKVEAFRMYMGGGTNYRHTVSLINEGITEDIQRSCTGNFGVNAAMRLSFLPSWGNFDVNAEWKYVDTSNSLRDRTTFTRNWTLGVEGMADLPCGFQLSTNATYYIRRGTGIQGTENDEILWNAKLSWKFLPKRQAELSLTWADILNQKKSYTRTVSSTSFTESYQEQLRSYIIVSLRYRLEILD